MLPIKKNCDICDLPFQAMTDATSTCTSCLLRPSQIVFIKSPESDKTVLSGDKKGTVLPGVRKTKH